MRNNEYQRRWYWLIISIIINSAANALTIATGMGSAVWTASAVNIAHWIAHTGNPAVANHILGSVLLIYGILVAFLASALERRFDLHHFISNILFIVPFSYLIQLIVPFFRDTLRIGNLSASWHHPGQLFLLIFIDIVGLFGVAIAVSIYQRANLILHPNDDLSYILRFKYLHGKPTLSQWASYLPPLTLTLMSFTANHLQVWAFGFGTIWAFLSQGYLQGWSDAHVIPSFKHHFNFKVNKNATLL